MDNRKVPEYMLENVVRGMTNLSAADTFYKTVFEGNPCAFAIAIWEFLEDPRLLERIQHWNLLLKTEVVEQASKNLLDPIGNALHTGHFMGRLTSGVWRVDHYFGRKMTTVDIVVPNDDGDYLGKAANRWERYDRLERIILHGNPEGHSQLQEVMMKYHLI